MRSGRSVSKLIAAAAVPVLLGVAIAGCSDRSRRSGFGLSVLPPEPRVIGILGDYTGERVESVPVTVLGTTISGPSRIDGLTALG